jgi:hypothetical protein
VAVNTLLVKSGLKIYYLPDVFPLVAAGAFGVFSRVMAV